jgi:hypothetical protein
MASAYLRPIETLAPGEHACLVYDSAGRRRAALATYLRAGLERGERVVFVERSPADLLAEAARDLRRRGRRLRLVSPPPPVSSVLAILGWHELEGLELA